MAIYLLFLAYILALLGLAAIVVPGIYPSVFEPIGLKPESSLYRFAMLAAALGMPFFLRFLALNSWRAAGYTLPRSQAWSALGRGLLVGIAIMVGLTGVQWGLDIHHFDPPGDKWSAYYVLRYLISGLISGLAVGFIEETFFRGLMHTGMRRRLAFWPTALLTSLLYAAVHFMKPGKLGEADFDITRAFSMIGEGLARLGESADVLDSFITLVVVGIFLSMVRERSGNILWAIGIHAGWVMVIKVMKFLTDPTKVDGQYSVWIGDYDRITGWMATIWLGIIALVFWYRTRPRD